MATARIAGTGIYAPGAPIDNAMLKRLTGVEFDSEKHEAKIGIKSRHIARLSGLPESSADFAEKVTRAEGRVKKGDLIVLMASGTGFSVGANLIRL